MHFFMTSYCGYIAFVGRPNVGKSTLLNRLMESKISITSRKPQTTRHRVLGIQTQGDYQFVFVDTPGIHGADKQMLNKLMNKAALEALADVDVVVWMIDATRWTADDELVLNALKKHPQVPCILVVNKVDKIKDKMVLLPKLQEWQAMHSFTAMIPLSAKTGSQVQNLLEVIKPLMPESPHLFYPDQQTDRPVKFQIAEILREKVFRFSGDELPYSTTVEVESMEDEPKMWRIHALIWVDKETHKRMLIGAKGEKMKMMASEARKDMEALLGKKVFLHCFCKVKSGWAEDARFLKEMGLDD
jgi:GTP-binding protein Era